MRLVSHFSSACRKSDSFQYFGQFSSIYLDVFRIRIDTLWRSENCSMKPLIKDTIPVSIPPDYLCHIRSLIHEHKKRAVLRVLCDYLAYGQSETIE